MLRGASVLLRVFKGQRICNGLHRRISIVAMNNCSADGALFETVEEGIQDHIYRIRRASFRVDDLTPLSAADLAFELYVLLQRVGAHSGMSSVVVATRLARNQALKAAACSLGTGERNSSLEKLWQSLGKASEIRTSKVTSQTASAFGENMALAAKHIESANVNTVRQVVGPISPGCASASLTS